MPKNKAKANSCGHKKSAVKSVGRNWRRWESLATESSGLSHIKCDTCKLLHIIENLAEPTGPGKVKYASRLSVDVFEGLEAAA